MLPPVGSKRVAVVVGRFNPPTKGHYGVISAVKKFVRQHPELKLEASPAVVVIGGGKTDDDKKRNPLTVEERTVFMKASGKANGALFFTAPDAFKAFETLREQGFEPIVIAAGSERVAGYKEILDNYFKGPNDKPITHHALTLSRDEDAVETKVDDKDEAVENTLASLKEKGDIPMKHVSGSVARRAVELGFEPEFAKIVGLEHKPKLAKQMYEKIKASLNA